MSSVTPALILTSYSWVARVLRRHALFPKCVSSACSSRDLAAYVLCLRALLPIV